MSQLETWLLSQMLLLSREDHIDFGVLLAAATGPARVSGCAGGVIAGARILSFSTRTRRDPRLSGGSVW